MPRYIRLRSDSNDLPPYQPYALGCELDGSLKASKCNYILPAAIFVSSCALQVLTGVAIAVSYERLWRAQSTVTAITYCLLGTSIAVAGLRVLRASIHGHDCAKLTLKHTVTKLFRPAGILINSAAALLPLFMG